MLLYVNCFYDFQEPCTPHQSLTWQQSSSRDLNFETETWLKLRDRDFFKKSETRKFADYAEMFLQIFKKLSSPLLSWNFANFRYFSYLRMQWRAEVWWCPGRLLDWMPPYKVLVLSTGVWWSLLLHIRCLWSGLEPTFWRSLLT